MLQPLQCVLQHHVSNPHVSTHMATKRDNNHTAITLRTASTDSKMPFNYAHSTHEQPHVAEQQGRTNSRPERLSRNRRTHTHTQGIFHRRLQPLCTEKHKASCSGFLPKTNPMQQSCGHYNAFCSMTWLTRMSRHTWQQCSGFLPNPSPRQHSCSHYNASCCGTCRFIQHVTTSLSLRFPQSPSFIASLRSSTCTFIQHVTTSLCHHCP